MKVAVYTIAKNETSFVNRWFNSANEADSLHILDTGSDDSTVTAARDFGIDVSRWQFDPFRFDSARNLALTMVPPDTDFCIALDMDEVLVEGWRDHLEKAFADGVTRPRYQYTWSWVNGKPGLIYGGDKIHSRTGYTWKHPVHEVLTTVDGFQERQGWYGLEIHHHPDSTKSRGHYLPLLELSVNEDPDDDRNAHYYARELYFAGRHAEAKIEFVRHLNLPTAVWKPERAASMRYLAKCDPANAWWWLESATIECPERREAWVDMACLDYENGEWQDCLWAATQALKIKERPLEYLCEERAWGSLPHDLAAIAAYHLGYYHQGYFHGTEAVKLSPYEDRLVENLRFYREAVA